MDLDSSSVPNYTPNFARTEIFQLLRQIPYVPEFTIPSLNWKIDNPMSKHFLIRCLERLSTVDPLSAEDIQLLKEIQTQFEMQKSVSGGTWAPLNILNMTANKHALLLNGFLRQISASLIFDSAGVEPRVEQQQNANANTNTNTNTSTYNINNNNNNTNTDEPYVSANTKNSKGMYYLSADVVQCCAVFYATEITIDVCSVGFYGGSAAGSAPYIKIDGSDTNLWRNGTLSHRWRGHSVILLENRFGNVLANDTFDTWGLSADKRRFFEFVSTVLPNTIVIVAISDSGENYSREAHSYLMKFGLKEFVDNREPMIFIGSSNSGSDDGGLREWTFFQKCDARNPGFLKTTVTIPLQS